MGLSNEGVTDIFKHITICHGFSLVDLVKWNSVILLSVVPNLLSSSAIFVRIHTFIFDTPFLLSISFSQMIMSAVY